MLPSLPSNPRFQPFSHYHCRCLFPATSHCSCIFLPTPSPQPCTAALLLLPSTPTRHRHNLSRPKRRRHSHIATSRSPAATLATVARSYFLLCCLATPPAYRRYLPPPLLQSLSLTCSRHPYRLYHRYPSLAVVRALLCCTPHYCRPLRHLLPNTALPTLVAHLSPAITAERPALLPFFFPCPTPPLRLLLFPIPPYSPCNHRRYCCCLLLHLHQQHRYSPAACRCCPFLPSILRCYHRQCLILPSLQPLLSLYLPSPAALLLSIHRSLDFLAASPQPPRTMMAIISFAHIHKEKLNRDNHRNKSIIQPVASKPQPHLPPLKTLEDLPEKSSRKDQQNGCAGIGRKVE
ncbi:hypothetical protein BHE74_00021079 [Ensete ventricosum]|nr:hypothetical protein BHE74_00021079 [Ensete ventricosum]